MQSLIVFISIMVKRRMAIKSDEPLSTLWKIIDYSIKPRNVTIFKVLYFTVLLYWYIIILLTFYYGSNDSLLKKVTLLIPMLFMHTGMAVMALHISNFYTKLFLRQATIKKLAVLKEFRLSRYKLNAKKSERYCYISCFILSVLIVSSFLIFHPIHGRPQDTPVIYFHSILENYGLIIHPLIFICMILNAYAQIFSIFHSLYRAWGMQILYYHLKEYIERHLCRKYYNFNVINSKYEQHLIHLHLKRCAQFHRQLKCILDETEHIQSIEILILCPIGIISFVAGLFYIFSGLNPENNWRIGFVLLTFSATFLGYCFHGQQISDIFEMLHTLFSTSNWEFWDTKNRKFLLILLPNTARKYEVTLAGLLVINYPLLLTAMKLSYSLLTLTLNLKN